MKKNNIFWISYSDLMTSLFFVMLVLFVVTVGYLKSIVDATKEQLEKIQELQTAVQELPVEYFEYQPQYKRFKLNKQIKFGDYSSTIDSNDTLYLIEVGNSIIKLISDLNMNQEYKKFDIKYLVVIEGMASKDNYANNFELSYERALSLYKLWNRNGISFDPQNCEIQVSGSGIEGIREYSGTDEFRNRQFLIHIIPKMGKIIEN
ncbi:MAG: flagellar motor protein MotB [Desulfobacula sp.]|nr:flagellar motor protein MotB [Desulfobacula sp.]